MIDSSNIDMSGLTILPTIHFLDYPSYQKLHEQYSNSPVQTIIVKQQQQLRQRWCNLLQVKDEELRQTQEVDWLIDVFNLLFQAYHVQLVRGKGEPEYFPAQDAQPARIEFAHGFFASALHEISHWCVAGKHRRTLSDFGYWYAPDGRTHAQQVAFEKVEIKPQAIEYLFTQACQKPFRVSQDNLFAQFDTSQSTFSSDVYHQAQRYLTAQDTLPKDAQTLLETLLFLCQWYDDFKNLFCKS